MGLEKGIFGKIRELTKPESETERAERISKGDIRKSDILRSIASMVAKPGTIPIVMFEGLPDFLKEELIRRSENTLESDNPNST